jgi:fibronectin-binding autotransporter adhesin
VNFKNAGGPVVLGGPTAVIVNTGAGTLNAAAGTGLGAFGLVNVSLQSEGNGNWDLVRTANTGAIAAPGASIMAALSAIDTSFHQSTSPFVVSPQSQDPDKWTGGVWSRATTGQTTTKTTATDNFGPASLRVKTNFDAYEVGVDTGMLNFGGTGWNGHFGILAGAVTATASEQLSGSGTSVKFDVPFAGIYGVVTHGPFFMDLEARHDWVDTHVTNITANLSNTQLKGHGDSVSGSAGYHFDVVDHWFVEPTAGFGLTQTQFDTLQTNLNQTAQGIAAGAISFDSMFSMLVHAGARVGTSMVVSDTLALQPFGTLSVWRELGGQSNATFANGGTPDPLTLSRVGTFYQAGLGLSAQLLNTGFVGFARGDIRWGDKLDGTSVVGGLRYTFAP